MFKGLLNRVKVDLVCIQLSMIFGTRLTDSKGQWGEQTKLLRIFDPESRSRFSQRASNVIPCWIIVVSLYNWSYPTTINRVTVQRVQRRPLPPSRGGRLR